MSLKEKKSDNRPCANPGCNATFRVLVGKGSGRHRPRIYCRSCAKLRHAMRNRANVRQWRKRTREESLAFRNLVNRTGVDVLRLATETTAKKLNAAASQGTKPAPEAIPEPQPAPESQEPSWTKITDQEVQEALKKYGVRIRHGADQTSSE